MPTNDSAIGGYKPAFDKYLSLCSIPSISNHARYLAPVSFEPEPTASLVDLLQRSLSMDSTNFLAPRGIQQTVRLIRGLDAQSDLDAMITKCQNSPLSEYLDREYPSASPDQRSSFAGAVALFDLKPQSLCSPATSPVAPTIHSASHSASAWRENYFVQAAGSIKNGARDLAGACWEYKYWALAPILVAVGLTAALLLLGQSTAPMAVYSLF